MSFPTGAECYISATLSPPVIAQPATRSVRFNEVELAKAFQAGSQDLSSSTCAAT